MRKNVINERIKQVLVDLAVNDDLPMDMTMLDSSVFDPCTAELIKNQNDQQEIRVYGINVDQIWDGLELSSIIDPKSPNDQFMEIAEAQGNVWSLQGFQSAFNNDELSSFNLFIKIV